MISRTADHAAIGSDDSIETLRVTPSHGFDASFNQLSGIGFIGQNITGIRAVDKFVNALFPVTRHDQCFTWEAVGAVAS